MKILVIGNGGREHSIGLKLKSSAQNHEILFAPGNPGMAEIGKCFPIKSTQIPELINLAQTESVHFTIVGPEQPLVEGIVDAFEKEGLKIFGPSQLAARLEGSKVFSKYFMQKYQIPTAAFQTFHQLPEALQYLKNQSIPIVIKASGLAAGKGAVVCFSQEEAVQTLHDMLGPQAVFGSAGSEVVIEEFMEGEEASVFAVCDGQNYVLLESAQDHKRIFDEDRGPNTGGMGAYAPAPIVTPKLLEQVCQQILEPTLKGMQAEGSPYKGVLYIGLMIKDGKSRVVEYNCRLGDPEAQVVLPLYPGDLADLLYTASLGKIQEKPINRSTQVASVVVMASQGYPASSSSDDPITGLENFSSLTHSWVVHSGTKKLADQFYTAGGRVLGVVGIGKDLRESLDIAYQGVSKIHFPGMQYRKDIGQKGLKALT